MNSDTRKTERYDDIGRVDAPAISPMPGVLDNISMTGCKVHYPFPVTVNPEDDIELSIMFARAATEGRFTLLCHPQWVKNGDDFTEIGFKFLPSKDLVHISDYIEDLYMENRTDSLADQIVGSICGSI